MQCNEDNTIQNKTKKTKQGTRQQDSNSYATNKRGKKMATELFWVIILRKIQMKR